MKMIETINSRKAAVVSIICLLCAFCSTDVSGGPYRAGQPADTLHVLLKDISSGLPLPHIHVNVGTMPFCSSREGIVSIPPANLPSGTFSLSVAGYQTITVSRDSIHPESGIHAVELTPEMIQLDESCVMADSGNRKKDLISEQITRADMARSSGRCLASVVSRINGVSSISSGVNSSKPVIHGLSGTRILIVTNGLRQTGQEWGIDHAPELQVDPSDQVTIIKGADAVSYGSCAVGGIIVMEPSALPYWGAPFSGSVSSSYGSNGHRYGVSGTFEGALPFLQAMAWRIRASYANSGDRSSARYVLNNTGSRELDLSAGLGYNSRYVSAEVLYTRFFNRSGFMRCAQIGSRDMFEERLALGRPQFVEPYSRHILKPYPEVVHHNLTMKCRVFLGKSSYLHWRGAWQNDRRDEYHLRRQESGLPSVGFRLNSFQNRLSWSFSKGNFRSEVGGQAIYIENHSLPGTGVVPAIPNYLQHEYGVYATFRYLRDKFGAEAGIRYDFQDLAADGIDWTGEAYGGKRKFGSATCSLGAHYDILEQLTVNTNFGVAWRPPHVHELYSNGNDLSSGIFMIGNKDMKSERGYKWISSLNYDSRYVGLYVEGYLQWIDGYIYDQPTKEVMTVISGSYPVFRYCQTSAFLRGAEGKLRLSPVTGLDYILSVSFIQANERSTKRYLPFIPSTRVRQEIRYARNLSHRVNLDASFTHRFVAKQERFDPETDLIPFTPPAYHLFDLFLGVEITTRRRQMIRTAIGVDNLFNREYKEYTNRSRYYAHEQGIDVRLTLTYKF